MEKIVVEIKSFINQSVAYDFHHALGQYLVYKTGLVENGDESDLFLAVPLNIFDTFLQKPFIQKVLHKFDVKVICFDPTKNHPLKWKK